MWIALRSLFAVAVGLVTMTLVVESIEFALVTVVHGAVTTDPVTYFGIRNRGWFLIVKLAYNTASAVLAGLITAHVAGRAPLMHGAVLALVQTAVFAWALTNIELRQWTPGWTWAALIVLTFAGVLTGASLKARRTRRALRSTSP